MNTFDKVIEFIEYSIASIAVITMVVSITLEVIFRYFLNLPLSWCEELARFATIWMSFIGTAITYRHRDLVMMDVIDKICSEQVSIFLNLFATMISIAFFVVLIYGEIELQFLASASKSLALGIPMNVWSMVILFSGVSMLISAFKHTRQDIKTLIALRQATRTKNLTV